MVVEDCSDLFFGGSTEVFGISFSPHPKKIQPDIKKYTWWNYRTRARSRGLGWRIDYFLVRREDADKIKDTKILNDIMGSDHCPIYIEL